MTTPEDAYAGDAMPLISHLRELRDRLIKAILALILGTVLAMPFTDQAMVFLISPLTNKPQALNPTDAVVQWFKVAFVGGVAIGMPIILYQLIAFLVPALTRRERRYLLLFLPGGTLLFVAGLMFGGFVAVPASLRFLQGFGSEFALHQYRLSEYVSYVTTLLLALGLGFQTPLVIFFIAKLGIVTYPTLIKNIRWAFLVTAILAAVLTPTPDPWNMFVVMLPLFILYLMGVFFSRWA